MNGRKFHIDESRPWFSEQAGWPGEVPKNFDFPELPLGEMLDRSAEKWPEKKAVWFLDRFTTFAGLNAYVNRFAVALYEMGIRKGDVVAFLLPNSLQFVISYYACAKIGAISTGINPLYKPKEILQQLQITGAKALITLDDLYETVVDPIIEKSSVSILVVTSWLDFAGRMARVTTRIGTFVARKQQVKLPSGTSRFLECLRTKGPVPDVNVKADDVACYSITGGITGTTKAAILTHFNCVSNAIQSNLWLWKIKPGAATLGVLPLFHSFAMTCVMNLSVYSGGFMILYPKMPTVDQVIEKLLDIGPDEGTLVPGVEDIFRRIAQWPDIQEYDVKGKISMCVSGAGPLHDKVQEMFENQTGARVVEGYGLTEASPVISAGPFWGNRKIGTIGLPFPGTDWRIVDELNPSKIRPIGEAGEIAVCGPQVMKGYLNDKEETDEVLFEANGDIWLLTGDIGIMDEQGCITIVDRKKQLIKYKGWSVFPKEVEMLLMGHPAIENVSVAGLADPKCSEVIKAWVVLKPKYKGKLESAEIKQWAKETITHYKVPAHVEIIDSFPEGVSGKSLRRMLQESDPLWIDYSKCRP